MEVFIIFPLTPVIAAVVIVVLALASKFSEYTHIVTTASWIVFGISSAALLIANIVREGKFADKIIGTLLTIVSTAISLMESRTFLDGLVHTRGSGEIGNTIEFLFVLIFGGLVWFGCIFACAYASFICYDDDDDWGMGRFIKAGALMLISFAVGRGAGLLR